MYADSLTPWYRQFWPWVLILLPLSAVLASLATLAIAMHDPDGLVVDDYYKQGLAINQTLDRQAAARRMGLSAALSLQPADGRLELRLEAESGVALPEMVDLHLLYATRAGFDRRISLRRVAEGRYQAALPELRPGRWNLHLEAQEWRLSGSLQQPGAARVALSAGQG